MANFIYGLGIDNVGLSGAKALCRHFDYDFEAIRNAQPLEIAEIDGFGDIIAASIYEYFQTPENNRIVDNALTYVTFVGAAISRPQESPHFAGKTFVITGDLTHFKNRKELTEHIENLGGKVAGSVSSKTDYLINNDTTSASSKNKKASELGIAIISEQDFLALQNG